MGEEEEVTSRFLVLRPIHIAGQGDTVANGQSPFNVILDEKDAGNFRGDLYSDKETVTFLRAQGIIELTVYSI